ncbi:MULTISPECIES: DUF397 domain-containing protein [unclassified Micromonospora]|uniref:DUF397 domain-containing protein n=1 Tax=unclassified Micromonospora TaxID=2617518 RepID=UPI0022B6E108|nr:MULTISPECIES: DUF397 domain-containing protein [unclassified Micromonospora]MCZ7420361.1 DUF397 domain-containing protein [Verrucosispora sp. WMMA2121]WBB94565.1 DUF397 domain-containing protein [Verrucosispora sp. WMMC514]
MWRTSSRSGSGECVEVAGFVDAVGVRDSKDRQGAELSFGVTSWTRFVAATRAGRLAPRT